MCAFSLKIISFKPIIFDIIIIISETISISIHELMLRNRIKPFK